MVLSPLLLPALASVAVFLLTADSRIWVLGGLMLAVLLAASLPGQFIAYYATILTLPLALLVPGVFEWLAIQRRRTRLAVLVPGTFLFGLAAFTTIGMLPRVNTDEPPSLVIGKSIEKVALGDDRLWIWGNQPQLYYYARVRPAHHYLVSGSRPSIDATNTAAVIAAPPRFIVVEEGEDLDPILALLRVRYEVLDALDTLVAYRRRD